MAHRVSTYAHVVHAHMHLHTHVRVHMPQIFARKMGADGGVGRAWRHWVSAADDANYMKGLLGTAAAIDRTQQANQPG